MIQASKHVQLILMCTTVKIAKAFIFFPNVTNTHRETEREDLRLVWYLCRL